jgi:hypothetical protein
MVGRHTGVELDDREEVRLGLRCSTHGSRTRLNQLRSKNRETISTTCYCKNTLHCSGRNISKHTSLHDLVRARCAARTSAEFAVGCAGDSLPRPVCDIRP